MGPRPEICLYYPYYEVRDEVWVKEALLHCDKVATIVPVDVDLAEFKSQLYRTLADRAAVEAWPVSGWVREQAARRILDLLDAVAHVSLPEGPPFRLNLGKLSTELTQGLRERGIEQRPQGSDVEVEFGVGTLVMCALAHHLGEQTLSRPATDDFQLGSAFISVLGSGNRAKQVEEIISRDLAVAVPDVRNIELDRWLDFRDRKRGELILYREELDRLARELAGAEDSREADSVLARHQQELEAWSIGVSGAT